MASSSITRRPNGKWRARFRDEDGKEYARHFDRKLDGQRWLDENRALMLTGMFVSPNAGRMTFKEYAEQWRALQVHHRPSTADAVRVSLEKRVYPRIGDKKMRSIRSDDIAAMVAELSETYKPATVTLTYSYVATIFKAAVAAREVARTPCVGIKMPEVADETVDPKDVLTVENVHALVKAMPEHFKPLVLLAAGTGLRQGEAFGLTRDRVNFLKREIVVDRQLVMRNGKPSEFGPTKTRSSNRVIPLPQVVADALSAHIKAHEIGPEDLLFRGSRGATMRRNTFSPLWQAATTKAGLEGYTFHALRHHYASLLIEHGESVKVVQARLGHKSAEETLNTYARLWPNTEDRTRQAVDAALGNVADYLRTEAS